MEGEGQTLEKRTEGKEQALDTSEREEAGDALGRTMGTEGCWGGVEIMEYKPTEGCMPSTGPVPDKVLNKHVLNRTLC